MIPETWVAYAPGPEGLLPMFLGRSERDAWRKAAQNHCVLGIAGVRAWLKLRQAEGWRCLQVVPKETT